MSLRTRLFKDRLPHKIGPSSFAILDSTQCDVLHTSDVNISDEIPQKARKLVR